MFQELETPASELILIKIDSAIQKILLPQSNTTIEKGKIIAVEAYSVTEIANTPAGQPVVNAAAFNNSFVTFRDKDNNKEWLHQIPMKDLKRDTNSGIITRLKEFNIDLSLSYIEVGNTGLLVLGEWYMFRFIYRPSDMIGCPTE
jgi:hypothetical protein